MTQEEYDNLRDLVAEVKRDQASYNDLVDSKIVTPLVHWNSLDRLYKAVDKLGPSNTKEGKLKLKVKIDNRTFELPRHGSLVRMITPDRGCFHVEHVGDDTVEVFNASPLRIERVCDLTNGAKEVVLPPTCESCGQEIKL